MKLKNFASFNVVITGKHKSKLKLKKKEFKKEIQNKLSIVI